jgi:hypothetical protein
MNDLDRRFEELKVIQKYLDDDLRNLYKKIMATEDELILTGHPEGIIPYKERYINEVKEYLIKKNIRTW